MNEWQLILVPVVLGVVEAIRRSLKPLVAEARLTQLAPLMSLAVAFTLAWIPLEPFVLREYLLGSIVVGLSASGLYSGGKAVIGAS